MVLTWRGNNLWLNLGKLHLSFEKPLPQHFTLWGSKKNEDRYLLSDFDRSRIYTLRGDIRPI